MKHPVVYFEIGCRDGDATRTFFQELFGWDISAERPAMQIATGGPPMEALNGHIVELAPEWGPYVTIYVQVEDLESCLKRAEELGGKTLVSPQTLPGGDGFAWMAAPEGNIIGLWRPRG